MEISEFNNNAFHLVSGLIVKRRPESLPSKKLKSEKAKAEPPIIDLPEEAICLVVDINDRTKEIWLDDHANDKMTGFPSSEYQTFTRFCQDLMDSELIDCSYHFLERTVFKWLISVKRDKKPQLYLIDYLESELEKVTEEITFYYQVTNMEIDQKLTIGHVHIDLFPPEKYKKHIELIESKGYTEEDIYDSYGKKLKHEVFAVTTLKGEPRKIKEQAFERVTLAINVLKITDDTVRHPFRKSKFGLELQIPYQPVATYFQEVDGHINPSLIFENDDYKIGDEDFDTLSLLLSVISNFIKNHKENELNRLVLHSINLFGNAISTYDPHWRAVLLIQIVEFLMLKDDQKGDMEQRAKSRISKLLTEDFKEKEQIKENLSHLYQLRHKMVHKVRKIQIDEMKYASSQHHIVQMIMSLIDLDGEFSTKDELIDHLNQIKS